MRAIRDAVRGQGSAKWLSCAYIEEERFLRACRASRPLVTHGWVLDPMFFAVGWPRVLQCLPEAQAQRQAVVTVAFSPDMERLAVVTSASVQIWNGRQVRFVFPCAGEEGAKLTPACRACCSTESSSPS